ncbi:MAG TPA: outer membrane beta-barrel protein [Devosia sp.]|jgi:outer membrane immunogenic protein|uniref:outer membrane protein n=1 Tax=Devosia sp. TaxID=1871048 RepID=UPI002DDDB18C|nr:outer membrane beta-barrel protein [Devosia sp.]HEV2515359.1 outer membrane beta-barrel protein [Devosia sp.]
MKHITTILLATVAAAGLMSSAYAADLIIEQPMAEVGVVDVGGNWDGPYIGVFGGYGWGFADDDASQGGFGMAVDGNDIDLAGGLVGVVVGANFAVSDGVVAGIAADLAWANIGGDIDPALPGLNPAYIGSSHTINWQGSLRGVLGFDAGSFMPYLTAGLAVANAERYTPIGATETVSATHVGWTIGAGAQVAVTDDLSVDLQYRYSDFGEATYDWTPPAATDRVVGLTTHALTVGLNWNF